MGDMRKAGAELDATEPKEFTFADHFKEWCELDDEAAKGDISSYDELRAALINAFPMIRKTIAEKDAQIAALKDEMLHQAKRAGDLQSANERIEALTAERDEHKAHSEGRWEDFGHMENAFREQRDQLSALQRAAREYMEATDAYTGYLQGAEADTGEIERHERAEQALIDLLK